MVAFFKSAFALQYVLWDDPFQVVTHLSVKKKKNRIRDLRSFTSLFARISRCHNTLVHFREGVIL